MRDLIWTIIIIWIVFKVIAIFRTISVKKTVIYNKYESDHTHSQSQPKKDEGSITVEATANQHKKTAKPNATDGEYVDFEEIK